MSSHDAHDDDYDDVPLHHKKPFGAGLKRKREVAFVRASDPELHTIPSTLPDPASESSVSDLYLNLVLKKSAGTASSNETPTPSGEDGNVTSLQICEVCKLPLIPDHHDDQGETETETQTSGERHSKHHSSIAHQVCLTHNHPPSAVDRSRMGLTYLSSYGWDPDSRRGLGAEGQGIVAPIRPKFKDDTLGLGMEAVSKEAAEQARRDREERKAKNKKVSIKEMRKRAAEEKKRAERLQDLFYQRDDVLKYLGNEI